MADIKPFKIAVPESDIVDLQQRLALARFPQDELSGSGWDYGTPLSDVKRLTAYWRDRYDWRKAEAALNQLPHFTTPIQCTGFEPLTIHFLHARSPNPAAIPLLFVHGWPGSFLEATKIIKSLPHGSPSFHVVALSLPNYGFSTGSTRKGFALEQYAETCHKLMLALGYTQYATQGGDWGMFITRTMSILYPQHCRATHINMDSGTRPTWTKNPLLALQHALTPYSQRERDSFSRMSWFLNEGSGYRHEQSTKPQTIGYAFADSPTALLAWIYEKLHDWTDAYPWTDDEVCTWMSIYWFSAAGPAASARIYYESTHDWFAQPGGKITRERLAQHVGGGVKLGFSHFPKELRPIPKTWARTAGDVVFQREHEAGGHFAAWERPGVIVADLREMFGRGGGAHGVVEGRDGYGEGKERAKL